MAFLFSVPSLLATNIICSGAQKERIPATGRQIPQYPCAHKLLSSPSSAAESLEGEDWECVNAIRFLSVDAVEKAKSGHPGLPMGAAPMAYILWQKFLNANPANPAWFNRDRFVLSAGHGCMLHYALLHLAGYDVSLDDLKNFRQWGSKTPGHPENTHTPGIEVTTGPLGQGIANAVGLAMAEAHLAARYNKPDAPKIVDHYTYALVGDGCLQEGVASEAASLAGHLKLNKLIALYDDNKITIDGSTSLSFTEDVGKRFESYGWQVIHVKDGNTDLGGIEAAIQKAKMDTTRPTLIKVSTTIGYGSPNKAGKASCHGAALGGDEVALTRDRLRWRFGPFDVPREVRDKFRSEFASRGRSAENQWKANLQLYAKHYPKEASEFQSIRNGTLPLHWEEFLPNFSPSDKPEGTRVCSGKCLNAIASVLPGLMGGSADLAPSNNTLLKGMENFSKQTPQGRNIRFGVREHGMGAIANGIALHSPGLIPYCATFFVFTDYMRPAIRMAALSKARTIFVMTHDSIGLGEDGPTHQPVEHLAAARAIPGLSVIRPADGTETSGAYLSAVSRADGPTLLVLSRQALPQLEGSSHSGVLHGAYVISDNTAPGGAPDLIMIASGSEVHLSIQTAERLRKERRLSVRVVSFPSWDLFKKQDREYRSSVLPPTCSKRLVVEAALPLGWEQFAGCPETGEAAFVGVETFGASAPGKKVLEEYGFSVANVEKQALDLLEIH
eukprot:Rmarinus@m.22260